MKRGFVLGTLCLLLVAGMLSACGDSVNEPAEDAGAAEPEKVVYFENDELVNQFIDDVDNGTDYTVEDAHKGNIDTKCICSINDCYTTIIDTIDSYADYNIEVSITGGTTQEDTEKMLETAKPILKVLDPSLSNETIDEAFSDLLSENHLKEDYAIGDDIKVMFVPCIELSNGPSTSRIDIHSYSYNLK